MARGRKSSVSLAVVPPALPGERPAPPAALDDTAAGIWRAIVGTLPPAWLDAAAQGIPGQTTVPIARMVSPLISREGLREGFKDQAMKEAAR